MNLLSNSIKFTSKGSIDLIGEQISPSIYEISVQDSGIGITQNQIKKIFQPYNKGDDANRQAYKGGTRTKFLSTPIQRINFSRVSWRLLIF